MGNTSVPVDLKAVSPLPGTLSCPLADAAFESFENYAAQVGAGELAFRPGVRYRTSFQGLIIHTLY